MKGAPRRRGGAASALPRAAVVALAAFGASCGDGGAPYAWRAGAVTTFEVRVREELLPTPVAREVQVACDGTVEGGNVLALRVVRVRHERRLPDGSTATVETHDVGAVAAERGAEDAAIARVAESLLGRPLRLAFDPDGGLRSVEGFRAALAAAAGASDPAAEEARDGLFSLLGDEVLLRSLRAAGLAEVPAAVRDGSSPVERFVDVVVPGRGAASLRIRGKAGEEKDGSPVVRCDGRLRDDAAFAPDPGAEAPPEFVGSAVVERVEAETETLHDRDTLQPLRGRATVRIPFTSGATVSTRTSLTLSVRP